MLTHRKATERRGKIQLIDATSFWTPMRKSLGNKRRELPEDKAAEVLALHEAFAEGDQCKIYPTTHFGFRKVTVERPLQLNFQASPERLARLEDERGFQNLAVSKKKKAEQKAQEEAAICRVECGKSQQPVFVKAKGEDEAFYVRTGPSSTKMSASEQAGYISSRFA